MSGFSFPPPPPPPPNYTQATSNQSGQGYQYNSESRSDRDRGGNRGGQRGRGHRGNGFSNSNGQRGGRYSSLQTQNSQRNSYNSTAQHWHSSSASYSLPGVDSKPNSWTTQPGNQGIHNAASPPRTAAGHKRKLDALRPHIDKTQRPRPPTAPAIPSFGAPILSLNSTAPAIPNKTTTKSRGRSLGLTPATNGAPITYSDSEDDDLDEEAMYAELGNKLTFEHNGVVMSLKSQADLVAWKKERQKNWPTRARMAERDEERRRIGEERRRLLNIATPSRSGQLPKARAKQHATFENGQTFAASLEDRASRLDELRKKVLDSAARNREAKIGDILAEADTAPVEPTRATVGEPPVVVDAPEEEVMFDDGISRAEANVENEASEESSSESSANTSSDSSSDSDSDSDNEAPEEISSKLPDAQLAIDTRLPCRYFATRGYCKFGDACQYKHETSLEVQKLQSRTQQESRGSQKLLPLPRSDVQKSSGRKGIFQRLKEQEQEEEDRLALKFVKYLGRAGFFSESPGEGGG